MQIDLKSYLQGQISRCKRQKDQIQGELLRTSVTAREKQLRHELAKIEGKMETYFEMDIVFELRLEK